MLKPLLGILVFILAGCGSAPVSQNALPSGPALDLYGIERAQIEGVWRSRGYGWIYEIGRESLMRYDISRAGCYPFPESAAGATAMLSIPVDRFRISPDGNVAEIFVSAGSGGTYFDRLASLPEGCASPLPTDPSTSFDVALSLFEEHYAHFDARGVDWNPLRKRAETLFVERGANEMALKASLDLVLQALNDSHVKVLGSIDEEPFRLQHGQGETLPRIRQSMGESQWLVGLIDQTRADLLDEGAHHVANDRIVWGTIDGRIGYLQVFVMGGFTELDIGDEGWAAAELAALDQHLDDAFSRFQAMDTVILDLSNNRGGYSEVAKAIAGRFAAQDFMGYSIAARGATDVPLAEQVIAPAKPGFTGPAYVLVSDVTVSGGELSTLSLSQLPNITVVGQPTRGSFSTPLSKPLPNGWIIEVANQTYAGQDGTSFAGRGVSVDVPMEVFAPGRDIQSHMQAVLGIIALHDQSAHPQLETSAQAE